MVDMIQTSSSTKFRPAIGVIDSDTLIQAQKALNLHLGLV
jgi:hypothetical protein